MPIQLIGPLGEIVRSIETAIGVSSASISTRDYVIGIMLTIVVASLVIFTLSVLAGVGFGIGATHGHDHVRNVKANAFKVSLVAPPTPTAAPPTPTAAPAAPVCAAHTDCGADSYCDRFRNCYPCVDRYDATCADHADAIDDVCPTRCAGLASSPGEPETSPSSPTLPPDEPVPAAPPAAPFTADAPIARLVPPRGVIPR